MNILPRVEFELEGKSIQGDILGFVPVSYSYPDLPFGQSRSRQIKDMVIDGKGNVTGGIIEDPTGIFAMVGCDDGKIRKVHYSNCRYLEDGDKG